MNKFFKNLRDKVDSFYSTELTDLDKELVNKYFRDANVVHHLAGITDVPRTKSESSDEKNERIKLVAEEGTQNILDAISDKCKIIFPSTHVVLKPPRML